MTVKQELENKDREPNISLRLSRGSLKTATFTVHSESENFDVCTTCSRIILELKFQADSVSFCETGPRLIADSHSVSLIIIKL